MPLEVCMGANLLCSFGAAPSTYVVVPLKRVLTKVPAGNITDEKPAMNVPPFGVCTSLSNPVVAAATAAALGVLTPQPCVPALVAPWIPTVPTVVSGGGPALGNDSKLTCMWGGMIQVVSPGQTAVKLG